MKERKENKHEHLCRILGNLRRVAIAYSGGVDSTFLLKVALDTLGSDNVIAILGSSGLQPYSEIQGAFALAKSIGARVFIINTYQLEIEGFTRNAPDRCYHCKKHLFDRFEQETEKLGFHCILDGSNADDIKDYRPGALVLKEKGIESPLRTCGFRKEDIRALSFTLGLPIHNKPSESCLATRVPYGTPITREILGTIDRSESFIKSLGIQTVRIRHHGPVARIEVEPSDFQTVLAYRREIENALVGEGFTYVALDLNGYVTGNMNKPLGDE